MRPIVIAVALFIAPQLSSCSDAGHSAGEPVGMQAAPLNLAAGGVITNAADNQRTAWYSDQAALAPNTVGGSSFGKLFSASVDGQVYAQPLVSGGTLFIVTETNHVYALDAGTGAVQASRALVGTPFNPQDVGCSDLLPSIGVTGTPVIDASTNTAYFFAKTYANGSTGSAAWDAHAVDVNTLQERSGFPVRIQGAASNDHNAAFNPTNQHQRPGLLLLDGVVYAGFGAHCDHGPYRGWIAGVTVGGQLRTLWTTEAGATQAGIWQSGGGLVSDGSGQIIFSTGNGTAASGPTPGTQPPGQLGEAVVRATVQTDGSLKATDFFMASDAEELNQHDVDLGSGGPVALPDSFGTQTVRHLLVEEGKEGYLYLLNRDALGGYQQGTGGGDAIVQRLGPDPVGKGIWGRPSVWPGDGGYVYVVINSGPMRAYARGQDAAGNPTLSLAASTADNFGYTSGSVAVTSNGTTPGTALVWVVWSSGASGANAQLRAYDATPTNGTFHLRFSAAIGNAPKFALPGIANGRVYVGTRDGTVLAFGAPSSAPLQSGPLDFGTVVIGQSKNQSVTLTANTAVNVTGLSSNDSEFAVTATSPTLPAALNPGDTLTASVSFEPTIAGLRAATLSAATSVGTQPFPMSGTAQTAQASLVASPTLLSIGGTIVGHTLGSTMTLTNQGAQPLTFGSVTPPSSPFSVTGLPAPGATLDAGQTITATVTFSPTTIGAFTGSVVVGSTGGDAVVSLSASAAAPGHLIIAPSAADAGNVAVGGSGLATFVVTNTGPSRVTISKSKPPAGASFSVFQDIPEGTTVDPNASVTGIVRFTPTATGLAQDQWALNADDDQGLRSVPIQGNGVEGIAGPAVGGWTLNGTSAMSGSTLVLTPATNGAIGSAFWPTAIASQFLTINFDAAIDSGTGADGLTLTLANPAAGATATSLGTGGGGLGFAGIAGVAIALDTYQNATNPSANFVGISDGTGTSDNVLHWLATSSNVPTLRGTVRHVTVTINGGTLVVAIDGVTAASANVTLGSDVLVGFTAACGGQNDRHAVSNVSISTDPILDSGGAWQLNGKTITTATGFQLTDTTPGAAGSVFWTTAIPSGSITASFDASIGGGTGADGLAFVLADPTAGATALGTAGGGLGFAGIKGIAVALDTYKNAANPSNNFIGISDGAGSKPGRLHWLATSTSVPPLRGTSHHVVVTVSGRDLSVTIDGAAAGSAQITLPQNVLVGFTAGSGGQTDRHAVEHIHVTGIQ